jgi:hypothetical protein
MDFNSTEHSIGWFRDQYRDGTLEIRPPYQRKPVWAARQKSFLIESILLGLPVPEVYIQQVVSAEGDSAHAVVDGQQRIRSILQFIGAEDDPEEREHNRFALDKLPTTSRFYNTTFEDLSDLKKRAFYGYRLSVRILETEDEDEVRDMFTRLNKYLTQLKPAELRNATFTGPFARLANTIADENEYWAEAGIVSAQSIRRMGDIEFVAELLIGVMHGPQGGSARSVDQYYEQYEDFEDEFPNQRAVRRRFRETLELVEELFPDIKAYRWRNKTDFYSLFVVLAQLLRTADVLGDGEPALRDALIEFAAAVSNRLADEEFRVTRNVAQYVRALSRGANDKARRGERHLALKQVVQPFFGGE